MAFYDATCPKCKRKVGWSGKLSDRPACPRCGAAPPPPDNSVEAALAELREKLLEEKLLED